MSDALARDPVFGEVARALCPRALPITAQRTDRKRSEADAVCIVYRKSALSDDDRVHAMRARFNLIQAGDPTHDRFFGPGEWLTSESLSHPAFAAFLAAWDSATTASIEPRIMGVVNVTPDSFSDGGRFLDAKSAIEHGLALERQGAAILDIGGESTRPGSEPVSVEEELARTIPVVEGLAKRSKALISIDTTKSAVARAALDAGASIVNDVSAGRFDDAMLPLVAERGATYIAMHMQGEPRDMQKEPHYGDVVADVLEFLRERGYQALRAGIARDKLWIDPGIGFGKQLAHNLELLRRLPELRSLGLPIVLGVSRKSFIAKIHPPASADRERLGGTAAALTIGVLGGAEILRVHDVAIMAEAAAVANALRARSDDSTR
jgi:dihydropteroate synthase